MAQTLEELEKLIGIARQRQDELQKLTAQQVKQPTWDDLRPEGAPQTPLANMGRMLGIGGSPEQRQYMLQTLTNKPQQGETRMDAWAKGQLKADEMSMKRAQGQHAQQVQASNTGAENAISSLGMGHDMYKLRQAEEAKKMKQAEMLRQQEEAAKKRGTVDFGGKVYQTDQYGQPIQELGNTEGEQNRIQENYYKQIEEEEKARKAALEKMSKAERLAQNASDIHTQIDDVKGLMKKTTPGMVSGVSSYIWGTDAYAYRKSIDSLRAKLGGSKLQELRAAAKSGASGYGNLTQMELERLEASIASLDVGLDKHDMERNLATVEEYFERALADYEELKERQGQGQGQEQGQGRVINWGDMP